MSTAVQCTLSVVAHETLGTGGFKTAHAATLLQASSDGLATLTRHFSGSSVVAKRPFLKPAGSRTISRYPAIDEVQHLINECNLTYWATALLQMTYRFIDAVQSSAGNAPFPIPKIRFVRAGFAYALAGPKDPGRAIPLTRLKKADSLSPSVLRGYMLEERIEGEFTKFVHNANPFPCMKEGEWGYATAQFLCFTQHAQYQLTQGNAIISDYQGTQKHFFEVLY
ncbi:hypothetical protein DFP72DRAFT_812250 [Ephemerocybe angulata]|uniref:Alpha-type protein kinase domain-containing protein n=1 Tax=Ephemerocybe angulata TaxID=980116 RepID=A0A8H6M8D6_9AGAR|nr:hypothetical protein DFP72DRAFT_812250 [Tulosesus angulatus]